jgi:hypothetical protein
MGAGQVAPNLAQGFAMGAQIDLLRQSTSSEIRLRDSEASYYDALAANVDPSLKVQQRNAAVGERHAAVSEAQATSTVGYQAAQAQHIQALTATALSELQNKAPQEYMAVALDNDIKRGTISAQAKDLAMKDLQYIYQEGQNQLQTFTRMHAELRGKEMILQNSITEYQLYLWENGINPNNMTDTSINAFTRQTFGGLPQPVQNGITNFIKLMNRVFSRSFK